jgi:hypothetical protein
MEEQHYNEWCSCCEECMTKGYDRIENEFPNCPFSISLDRTDMIRLDEPFTDENKIIIYDNRMDLWEYSLINDDIKKKYRNKLIIRRINDNKPITLRQILEKMSKSKHYNDSFMMCDHHFLECISKCSNVLYEPGFGS